jgi:hypothetical protein
MARKDSARADYGPAGVCAVAFAAMALWMLSLLGADLFGHGAGDVYFDTDTARVYWNLFLDHYQIRNSTHPLFATFVVLPVRAVQLFLGLKPVQTLPVVVAAVAALFGATFYLALRAWFSRSEAVVFTLLCAVTGSSLTFFPIVESFTLGALSILLCSFLVSGSRERPVGFAAFCLVFTYAITLTNAAIALSAIYFGFSSWKKRFQAVATGAGAIVVLTLVQASPIYPLTAESRPLWGESIYSRIPSVGEAGSILSTFFLGSAVMPAPRAGVIPNVLETASPSVGTVSFRGSRYALDFSTVLSLALWAGLLLFGTYSLATSSKLKRIRGFVFSAVLWNLMIHLFYGYETFLYSPHWVPLLVLIAAFSSRLGKDGRVTALAALAVLVIGFHNYAQAGRIREFIRIPGTPAMSGPGEFPFEVSLVDLDTGLSSPGSALHLKTARMDEGGWRLQPPSTPRPMRRPALLIRAAPESGSAIGSLARDGHQLHVNYRWTLLISNPASVSIGDEAEVRLLSGMKRAERYEVSRHFASGRGYAVMELDSVSEMKGCIVDGLARSGAWRICYEGMVNGNAQ